jgi:hypothetical protein
MSPKKALPRFVEVREASSTGFLTTLSSVR